MINVRHQRIKSIFAALFSAAMEYSWLGRLSADECKEEEARLLREIQASLEELCGTRPSLRTVKSLLKGRGKTSCS